MDFAGGQSSKQGGKQGGIPLFKKMATKKAFLYEGGELETKSPAQVSEEMPLRASFYTVKSEREQQAKKNIDKETQIMVETKKNWPRNRTLFYGLRFDYRNQYITLHIALFLARRIALAALLVFGGKVAYWGLQIMIASCILMLWLLLSYGQ